MEFRYYVVNADTWEVIAGFVCVLDADRLASQYEHLRATTADEVRKHHEDKYGAF